MPIPHLADATNLHQWADRMEARSDLPELIRRLIMATSNPSHVQFRAQEGTGYAGWDGHVETDVATTYVPGGVSGWEMGAGANPEAKATDDFNKRTKDPSPFDPTLTSFVFCTPRRWAGKGKWVSDRCGDGVWREIQVYDADDLAAWLADAPGVHVWLSLKIGLPIENVEALSSWYRAWSSTTSPSLSPEFLMSGRTMFSEQLMQYLAGPPKTITVQAEAAQEALAIVAAAFQLQVEDVRDKLDSRTILIEEPGAWRYFASQRRPLILIPRFRDDVLANQAVQNGHHVIVPVGADYRLPVTIKAPRLRADTASEVLRTQSVPSNVARHLAALARRSLAAYRRVRSSNPLEIPAWTQGESGRTLCLLVLMGTWDERVEGDRSALERMAECPYRDIQRLLQQWRNQADAPFRLIGSRWSVNAKEDAWRLLAQFATGDDLRRFVELAQDVLQERDPKWDLDPDAQLSAAIRGIRRIYSPILREGLADSLAMLGTLGSIEPNVVIGDGSNSAGYANLAVRRLMEYVLERADSWLDLAPPLPDLAEAAPDEFLGAIEQDLSTSTPTLLMLFTPLPGLISPNYEYPHLLWALEKLAWSHTFFLRVVMILARLATITPKTNITNSPLESLVSFFRLWLPQCNATVELRLQAIDQLHRLVPDMAWTLMIRLLPTGHDVASVSGGPGARAVLWREWPSEPVRPTRQEYYKSIEAVSSHIISDVSIDPTRWLSLIEHLPNLSPTIIGGALQKLEGLGSDTIDSDFRNTLWNRIRDLAAKHRSYPEAGWVMSETLLARLDRILDVLLPGDPVERYRWLFKHSPQLGISFREHDKWAVELMQQRKEAIGEIVSINGLSGVLVFAEQVESPWHVGAALFLAREEQDLPQAIIAALNKPGAWLLVAQGYIYQAVRRGGQNWIDNFLDLDTLNEWDDEMRAAALLCLPLEDYTIDLVESFRAETQRLYWRGIADIRTEHADCFHRAIEGLLRFDRPRKALDELAMHSYDKQKSIDIHIIQLALYQSAIVPLEQDPTQIASYDVTQLLKYLRNHPDSDNSTIEQLEWLYLPQLHPDEDSDHGRLRLHERLAMDPAFFVEIVGLRYKRDTETRPLSISHENAQRAFDLMESWHSVPGLSTDGMLDEVYLRDWLQRVIGLLKEAELMGGGHLELGQMLRWGPNEQDGVWPAPAICSIIQEFQSSRIDGGFRMEVFNSRGVTSRSPFEGGQQERELAQRYESYAEKLDIQWPRVAAILRELVRRYRDEAREYDQEAERDEDISG